MECMIKFAQVHEDFRLAEIKAIAVAENIDLSILDYSDDVRRHHIRIRRGNTINTSSVSDLHSEAAV
jgi:tRNA G10  N-methylase Trm11